MARSLTYAAVALLLAACASYAAPLAVTLPMAPPALPSRDVPKGEPLPVGTSVAVPAGVGTVDLSALAWSRDGIARIAVEWPRVTSYRLQLRAEGDWDAATRVRVLDPSGAPLHIDTWSPAASRRWWSAVGDGCCMVVEIAGRPGAGAVLRIVAADALGVSP